RSEFECAAWGGAVQVDLSWQEQLFPGGHFLQASRGVGAPKSMLTFVVVLLVISLIATFIAFRGISGAALEIAKVVFFLASVVVLIATIIEVARRHRPALGATQKG